MSGRYLLDTNIVIALFASELTVKDHLAKADEVFVSAVTIGELYFGAHKSAQAKENLARIDEFSASVVVLECNIGTARQYGEIKEALRLKGRPLPENDIWIAAIAIQHGLKLATRDTHFKEIDGLEIVVW